MFLALRDDTREALRRIGRDRRLTLLAVVTLALGIGAATAVFTVAHTILYAAPPFRDSDRIVSLDGRTPRSDSSAGASYGDLVHYAADRAVTAAALVGYTEVTWTGQSVSGFDGAEVLRGLEVTPDYFRVFDHRMALGRGFAREEGMSGHDAVVISHSLWQLRFGGRADIIGQTMTLDGKQHTIVGVAGASFLAYRSYDVLVWLPFVPSATDHADRGWACFARLAPGVSLDEAQSRIDALTSRIAREMAGPYRDYYKDYRVIVKPLLADAAKQARPALLALAGAVLCLLLVAAANVASLLLARATTSAREMSIRAALGAGRLRLFRLMLAEGVVLALLACAGGALIGVSILETARRLLPVSAQLKWAFAVDARVLAVAFFVSVFGGVAAGLAPASQTFRLAAGGLRPSLHRSRLLRAIVAGEIALAVLLSIGAGLLARSFVDLVNRPLGYETKSLLGMRVRLQGARYRTTEQKGAYWSQLLHRVGGLPGVARAASVSDLPMGWQYIGGGFEVQGATSGEEPAHHVGASPGYFSTLGIPVLSGRGFTEADGPNGEPVAIVNDYLARRFWPGRSALEHQIRVGRQWRRIVGVVRAVRHAGPQDDYQHEIYMPYRQYNQETMFLVVRSATPLEALVPAIRRALRSIDPEVPAFEIRTLDQAYSRETARPRLPVMMTAAFSVLALALAGLGLFGVVGYWVAQRARELAVRAALGAGPRELRWMVLRQAGWLMGVGMVAGLLLATATMRLLRGLMFGMSERDPAVYAGTIILVALVALSACWLPAARATRIDPAAALRRE